MEVWQAVDFARIGFWGPVEKLANLVSEFGLDIGPESPDVCPPQQGRRRRFEAWSS